LRLRKRTGVLGTVYDVNVNVKNGADDAQHVVPVKTGTHAELPKSIKQ
jgi:ribosomal protein S28E/S33